MLKRIVTCIAMFVLSAPALASFRVDTLTAMQMEAWRARMGFHQLAVRGNAPEDLDALEGVVAQGNDLIEQLSSQAVTTSEKDAVTEIDALWEAIAARAVDNPLASVGYADFNAFAEINSLTLDLHRELASHLVGAEKGANDALMKLGVDLLRMSSEYLALATFPSAGINAGTQETAMPFMQEAMTFEEDMDKLEKEAANDEVKRMLSTLKMRWTFIRGAIPQLDDPDAAKVPLLFYRYSSQTADDLIDMLAQ